jgi:SAM-dependent methyltransferase
MRDHLKYYQSLNKEVTLDLKDLSLNKIYDQRFNFYFLMSLTPSDLNNKSVLEFGSGTGYNAYYLIKKCNIKNITCVEKNYNSLLKLKKNLVNFDNVKIKKLDIYNYKDKKKYDFVICENVIDNFSKPSLILKKMMNCCKPGGRVILTFGDNYGIFSTKLRYLYALMLTEKRKIVDFNHRLKFLAKVFRKDLNFILKNTRAADKWVLDNILNINWVTKKSYFDLKAIKKIVKKKFLIFSFYPQFYFNKYFYKKVNLLERDKIIIRSNQDNKINLLCTKTIFEKKNNLKNLINSFNFLIAKLSFNQKVNLKVLNLILKTLYEISKRLNALKANNEASSALKEFIKLIVKFKKNDHLPLKTNNFYKFWSSYNQYLVLYKIK